MTTIDIFSGFLGAGKTTLIRKLIQEAYAGQKLVLIENEFGEIGVDGSFLRQSGVEIREINSGCICCSLVGDFRKALLQVVEDYHPERILIEPSGVGKLSDVVGAVLDVAEEADLVLGCLVAVADVNKVKLYTRNFGEFYNDQISHAGAIVLSRTDSASPEKVEASVSLLREKNPSAVIVTTPWSEISGKALQSALKQPEDLTASLLQEVGVNTHHQHHHEDHHEHHHHHHADDVFESFGRETARRYTEVQLRDALHILEGGSCGQVLRAKGILPGTEGWFSFDYVPGEAVLRSAAPDVTGRLCIIGSDLKEEKLAQLFQLS